jgi:hypothetical protein
MRAVAALAGVALTALALGACDRASEPFRKNNTELLQAGFMKHEPLPPPPATFCYETLADPMCYREPLAGEGERLIDSYPPRQYLPEEVLQ